MSDSTNAALSWNDQVLQQFRAGEQRIVDTFDRSQLLLLHTTGARSGEPRTSPLAYLTIDDQLVIIASAGGRDTPAWYFNLLARPEVTIERWQDDVLVSTEATAVPAEGAERDRLWSRVKAVAKGFAAYETKTSRTIPVVVLQLL